MDIIKLLHRDVLIEFVDGGGMQGYIDAHISADDNYPDPESIVLVVGRVKYEISVDEIKRITIITN